MIYQKITLSACIVIFSVLGMAGIEFAPSQPTAINISSSTGSPGSTITLTGEGFIGKLATVYWDDKKIVQNIPITKSGQINYTFEIPSAPKGTHTIRVIDDSNWSNITATSNFRIIPSLSLEPPWGRPTNMITIIGNGFAPGETGINIYFDSKPIAKTPITADKLGTWHAMFTVPDLPKGEYKLSVSGDATQPGEISPVLFTIAPFCKATPVSGPVGTRVNITGVGFRPGEDGITFTWDGPILDTNFTAKPNGSFSYDIVIPPSVKGRHVIGIYGSSFTPKGIVPDIEFEVVPSINITPSSLINSRDITIDGAGFNAAELVSISYDKTSTGKSVTTDSKGNFSITIKALPVAGKTHTITATGNKGAVAQGMYELTATVPSEPQLLYPGPGARIQMYNSATDMIEGLVKSAHIISTTSASSQGKNDNMVLSTMNWSTSDQQKDLQYTLQISKTDDFSVLVCNKEGITTTSYQLLRADIPEGGTYFWRVKATNEAGLSSPWSNTWKFDVISASPLIISIATTAFILIVAILIFGIMALVNRVRFKG